MNVLYISDKKVCLTCFINLNPTQPVATIGILPFSQILIHHTINCYFLVIIVSTGQYTKGIQKVDFYLKTKFQRSYLKNEKIQAKTTYFTKLHLFQWNIIMKQDSFASISLVIKQNKLCFRSCFDLWLTHCKTLKTLENLEGLTQNSIRRMFEERNMRVMIVVSRVWLHALLGGGWAALSKLSQKAGAASQFAN